jgi:hypothetical protein
LFVCFYEKKKYQETLANSLVNQTKHSKRKRDTMKLTEGVATSISQMSISDLSKKRSRRSATMDNIQEQTNNNNESSPNNNKPKYLKVPDKIFKEMLLKSLVGGGKEESIVQWFDTTLKLQYIRTYAHLLNNICYLKLEQDYWQHYDKVATTEGIWSSPLEKELIKKNNLYRINFKTKIQLDKHRQFIFNRLQKAENELNKHKQQRPINSSFDMNRLSTVLLAFVRQGQHKLSKDFERKKQLLQFDAHDYHLIKTFYTLKPTENQVSLSLLILYLR